VVAVLPERWDTWATPVGQVQPAILVLGDDPEATRLFQRFLDCYNVVGAATAAQAALLATRQRVLAVVTVGTCGRQELATLRHLAEAFRDLPTFACSLRTIRLIGRELGVADYLTKPVTRERLQAALRHAGRTARQVLVVDDDPEMVRLLSRMVHAESRRYRVRSATSGAGALAEMRAQPPDLVLLDLLMPDLDGYGVLEAMRADEDLRKVPVVVISARGIEEESVIAEALELARPGGLSVGELMRCLRASLDQLVGPPGDAPAQPAGSAS
jgi:CheY-like chemotaxis protein